MAAKVDSAETSKLSIHATSTFIHPGMLHTQADFIRMQTMVNAGTEPWLSGYKVLAANGYASLGYKMIGPSDTLTRTNTGGNYPHLMRDAAAAYQGALMWKISGNAAYANNAVHILNAWASFPD